MPEFTLVPLEDEGATPPEQATAPAAGFTLVPLDAADAVPTPTARRSLAGGAPGGGSELAHDRNQPLRRTSETMDDVALALSGDPDMQAFSQLSTKEGSESFVKAAKRLPGNVKKSIGAQATEMIAGMQEYAADEQAALLEQEREEALNGPFASLMPQQSKRYAKELTGRAKSELARGNVAAGVAREARLGSAEALPADAGTVEKAIQQGLASAAISAPATLVLGPVGGATTLGAGTGFARRSELLDQGLPEDVANQSALFQGSLEALTEFLPGAALVKKVPGFWKHVAEFLVTEVPGENVTTIAGMLDDYRLGLRDDVTLEDMVQAVKDTTLATVTGGVAQVGAAKVMQLAAEQANARAEQRAGGAPQSLAAGIPEPGPVETAPPEPDRRPATKKGVRREPQISKLPETAGGPELEPARPDLGKKVARGTSGEAARIEPQLSDETEEERSSTESGGSTEREALGTIRPDLEKDLRSISDRSASPEAVARLEAEGLAIRSETNVPRLTAAGRTELAKSNTARPNPAQTGQEANRRRQERGEPSRPRQTEEERLAAGRAAIRATDTFQRDLELARRTTDPQPTFAAAKAGNYTKGRLRFAGMRIALENPKGSTRHGYDEEGNKTWSRKMGADYGYIERTEGNDGDQLDVFLAGAPDTGKVFVVNQVHPDTGKFDEHKAILGAHTRQEAEKLYMSHYPKGWKGMGSMTELPTARFKEWSQKGDTTKPLDRRADPTRRQRVAEMTPQQMRAELLTHELTKIPNRRAYQEAKRLKHQVSIDVDSLKWVNDNMGHESGNELLKAVAIALKDETQQAYHISGDEFVAQADTPEAAHAVMNRVSKRLQGAKLVIEMPDGKTVELEGLGVSYGLGGTLEEADTQLQAHKAEREQKGQRAARGTAPPGARVRSPGEGREDQAGSAPAEIAKFARRKAPADKQRLEKEFIGRDDDFWNVAVDEEQGISEFRDTGYSGVQCTGFACAIRDKLGSKRVKIVGYEGENNPKAEVSAETGGGGHDFAIVDGRFIVDPWSTDIALSSKRGVWDLEDPADAKEIARLYGDQSTWEDMNGNVVQPGEPRDIMDRQDFRRWFTGSKVVDKDGQPLVVYHGSAADITEFDPARAGTVFKRSDIGIYFTASRADASDYAKNAEREDAAAAVYPAYVALKKPLILERDTDGRGALWLIENQQGMRKEVEEQLRSGRYDGLIARDPSVMLRSGEPDTVVIALQPTQIKSAIGNRGTFDPKNPDIRFARRPTFFSSVIAQTEALKQERASPEQWWNTISKRPGVKPEELDWMGLKEWLDSHGSTPVSKADVLAFMNANQITVNDVTLGAGIVDAIDQEMTAIQEELHAAGHRVVYENIGEGGSPRLFSEFDLNTSPNGRRTRASRYITYVAQRPEDGGLVEGNAPKLFSDIPDPELRAQVLKLRELSTKRVAQGPRESQGVARYERYTLPGGENYRELLLQLQRPPVTIPTVEPLTEVPEGYELIRDASGGHGDRWGHIPPGQTHARPVVGLHLTPADAKATLLRHLTELRRTEVRDAALKKQSLATYQSGHFDTRNILAHVRMKERIDADGKKMLFVEEIQSDWHQAGRKRGYQKTVPTMEEAKAFFGMTDAQWNWISEEQRQGYVERMANGDQGSHMTMGRGVPDAPFKTTWAELAMKRVIRWAAEHGFERVGWTTGQQQAERFNLSATVRQLTWTPAADSSTDSGGTTSGRLVAVETQAGQEIYMDVRADGVVSAARGQANLRDHHLSEIVGEDLSRQIMAESRGDLTSEDLSSIGGLGMKKFYDDILPKTVNKLIKKWGAKVGTGQVDPGHRVVDENTVLHGVAARIGVHAFDVTPEMRESALAGQPLFARRQFTATSMKVGDLPRDMREDIFNHIAMFGPDPEISERKVYALTVPMGPLEVASLPDMTRVVPREQYQSYIDAGIENLPPIVIADGKLWDGMHRIAAAQATGVKTLPAIDLTGYINTSRTGAIAPISGMPGFRGPLTRERVEAFADDVKDELGLEEFDLRVNPNTGHIFVELIMVPKSGRGMGTGTAAMQRLTEFADEHQVMLTLTPAGKEKRADWGTTSSARLERFYKRFGFVRNKGRNKRYELSDGMWRTPREPRFARFAPPFFSSAIRAVEQLDQQSADGLQWWNTISKRPGVKAEELEWMGLKDWLAGRDKIPKQELLEFMSAHQLEIQETQLGADLRPPHKLDAERDRLKHELLVAAVELAFENNGRLAYVRTPNGSYFYAPWRKGQPGEFAEIPDETIRAKVLRLLEVTEQILKDDPSASEQELHRLAEWFRADGYRVNFDTDNEGILESIEDREGREYFSNEGDRTFDDLTSPTHIERAQRMLAISRMLAETPVPEAKRARQAKYENYTLPGGEDYSELLIRMPERPEAAAALAERRNAARAVQRGEESTSVAEKALIEKVARIGKVGEFQGYDGALAANIPHWGYEAAFAHDPVLMASAKENLAKLVAKHAVQAEVDALIEANKRLGKARERSDAAILAIDGVQYQSQHFSEKNIVAHVRMKSRVDMHGVRTLFVEEVQSDWHQEARKNGNYGAVLRYQVDHPERGRLSSGLTLAAAEQFASENPGSKVSVWQTVPGVPDAPFKTSWPELAMKRVIRWAAEGGFDRVAWTTGKQQGDRYSLRKHVSSLTLSKTSGGIGLPEKGPFTYGMLRAKGEEADGGHVTTTGEWYIDLERNPNQLNELLGEELAQRLLNAPEQSDRSQSGLGARTRSLNDLDIELGGEGQVAFYDKILPNAIGKLIKKWGAKVGTTNLTRQGQAVAGWQVMDQLGIPKAQQATYWRNLDSTERDRLVAEYRKSAGPEVHAFDVTPAMRQAALEGQPLFRRVEPTRGMSADQVRKTIDTVLAEARFSRFPGIGVVEDYRGLPKELREQLEREGATETTGAVFIQGVNSDRVIVIAANNSSEAEVAENVYHELVGHYGLGLIMDQERYNEIMDGIARDMPDRVQESARRNSLDMKDQAQRRVAAEEVIAYAAGRILSGQPMDEQVKPWWKRVLEALRSFWERIRGKERFDEKAIARIVEASKRALQSQDAGVHKSLAQGVLRHQRAPLYYSALFEAMNDSKVANVAPPAEYAKILKSKVGKEIKPEEAEWSGAIAWLESMTLGKLLWQKSADLNGLPVPQEVQPKVDRFKALLAWQSKHATADHQKDTVRWKHNLDEALSDAEQNIGVLSRIDGSFRDREDEFELSHLRTDFNSVWNQVAALTQELRDDPALAIAPKRIPKSMLLDYIKNDQIVVNVIPSIEEEESQDWIDVDKTESEMVEPSEEFLKEQEDEATTPEGIRAEANDLIDEDPGAYLDEDHLEEIVDSDGGYQRVAITDEMRQWAYENTNVLQDAEHRLRSTWRRDYMLDYPSVAEYIHKMEDPSGRYRVEISGNTDFGYRGVFRGPNEGDTLYVDQRETWGEVESLLRRHAGIKMPRRIRTKYASYTVPGGQDYGEMLFIWDNPPDADLVVQHNGSHWDADNDLLHVRYDTRQGPKGEKILFIDEVQSDWHQEVRDTNAQAASNTPQVRFMTAVAEYKFQHGALWLADHREHEAKEPSSRELVLKWFRDLDLTNEQFQQAVIVNHGIESSDGPEYGWIWKFLADKRGVAARSLRGGGGATREEALRQLPLDLFDWKVFVNWLQREDDELSLRVKNSNTYDDSRVLAQAMNIASQVGSSYGAQRLGGLPPMLRTARAMMDRLHIAVPVYFDSTDPDYHEDPIVANDFRIRNEEVRQRFSDQIMAALESTEEGREIKEGVSRWERKYAKTVHVIATASPIVTQDYLEQFEQDAGLSFSKASEQMDRAMQIYMSTAKVPRVDAHTQAVVLNAVLELSEASKKVYDTYTQTPEEEKVQPKRTPPLAKSWPLAALKWALRHAAENGHEQLALAPGSVHGVRWGATRHYDRATAYPLDLPQLHNAMAARNTSSSESLIWDPLFETNESLDKAVADSKPIKVRLFPGEGTRLIDILTTESRLAGWIGKDAAEKILAMPAEREQRSISALSHGVTIWGPNNSDRLSSDEAKRRVRDIHHGSLEIYNSVLPFMFNKFLGKYGARIRPGKMIVQGLQGSPREKGLQESAGSKEQDPSKWTVRRSDNQVDVLDERGAVVLAQWDNGQTDEQALARAMPYRQAHSSKTRHMIDVPIIDLNDKLKDTALNRGFPLFARRWVHGARALGQAVTQGSNTFTMAQPSLTSRVWNYLVYRAQDKFIDLFRTQKAVARWRQAVGIPDAMDSYMRQELYHGRVEHRISEYEKAYVDPLVKMVKDSGYTWEQVEEYLYARHAPEANRRIRAINPNAPQFSSGMTDSDAAMLMRGYSQTPKFADLVAIGAHVDTMTKFSRDTMVMEGLEDPTVIQAWEQTYQHYVPLKGWAGIDIDTDMPKKGRGFDTGGKLTKMRTGRTTRATTILANVVAQAQSSLILAEKAKVGRALYDFVKSTPAPDLWVVDKVEYMRFVDPNTGLVREGINPSYKLADNVIRVRTGGSDYHITFNPENPMMVRLAAAMKNLNADQVGPIFSLLHGANRVLSSLNTSLNPEFVITNALRDLQTALANLTEQNKALLRTKVVRDWRKAWWGIRQGEGAPLARGHGTWAQHWAEFKAAGGKVGWIDHYKSPQDLEKKLRKELRPGNVLTYSVKGITALKDFIENENLAVENAIRLSTFVNLRAAGLSTDRAAAAAKNLTVNFNRKGEIGTVMNSLYLFYNASIQGTARLWQLAKHPKGRFVIGSFVVAGIAMDLLMRAIAGADEDRENAYDKVPEHEKERNIIVMLPPHLRGKTEAGETPYIKLMLPYGFSSFYYTGTVLGKYFDYGFLGNVRRVEPGADAGHVASSFLGSFSPIGDAGGGLSQFLLPTLADPFVQLADNKSWWGGKIMPEDFDEEAPRPDSQKYFQSVPKAYKDFAAWMNEKTGGTEISPGFIDVSPETFQHWTDFATGGAGRFGVSVINAPYKAIVSPEDLTQSEIPFWRKVVGGIGDRQTQETFYSHINELKYVKRELDAVYKMGINTPEGQERMAYIAKRYPIGVKMVRSAYPNFAGSRGIEDLDKDRILRETQKRSIQPDRPLSSEPRARLGQRKAITTELADARKEIKRLELRVDMPAAERKERIEALKKQIHEQLIEFNKQWNQVEDSTYGEQHQGKLLEKLGPLISTGKRRDQVKALREAGYPETAHLLFSLPSMPDRFAREFFAAEAAREEEA